MALAVALGAVALPAAAAAAGPARYVALGDSYTAAPLVTPVAQPSPPDCFRSAANYPHLAAAALGLALTDRSCSGATTADLTAAQHRDQPAQFTALTPATAVVTLGIGGNDNQLFTSAIVACSITDVLQLFDMGAPCRTMFGPRFVDEVQADAAVIGRAMGAIHALAPNARVLVVGYPDILPQQGRCYPQLLLTTADVAYLNGVELALNAMLKQQAATHGATFVDTFTGSIGHDACKAEPTRWVEPLIPGTNAFPIHPNARGEAASGRAVIGALGPAVTH